MSSFPRTLVVGDHFVPARYYVQALTELGADPAAIDTLDWSGSKAEQHEIQQRMEHAGPDAAPVPTEIVETLQGKAYEALAVHFAPVPRAVLDACPTLRAVVVARAGIENVDTAYARGRGLEVRSVQGRNASAVAELAIGLMLCAGRDIARADTSVHEGGWRKDFGGPGDEIGGSTVGLIGFGHVARTLAKRLQGFGIRLLVADPYVEEGELAAYGAERVELDTLLREADWVHVMARLTPETERLIGARELALMKPTAYLINTSRSRLVDTDALYETLQGKRIAGAGIDVYDHEPLPADSPWRTLDNVTFTTHFGGDTTTTNVRSARLVAEQIALLAGDSWARDSRPGDSRPEDSRER